MTEGKERVNAQIDGERKREWEEYADENHHSVSQLIRLAVEKEIHNAHEQASREATTDDDTQRLLSELADEVDRFGRRFHDLENRLATIEQAVTERPEVQDLANDVFQVLPIGRETILGAEHGSGLEEPPEPGESPTVKSGLPEDIATALDVEEHEVEDAIDLLRNRTNQIYTAEIAGKLRYFKEE